MERVSPRKTSHTNFVRSVTYPKGRVRISPIRNIDNRRAYFVGLEQI